MNPKLKPPGTKRLELKCDILLSNFGFKFNLRRYNKDDAIAATVGEKLTAVAAAESDRDERVAAAIRERDEAGAYTRSLLSST